MIQTNKKIIITVIIILLIVFVLFLWFKNIRKEIKEKPMGKKGILEVREKQNIADKEDVITKSEYLDEEEKEKLGIRKELKVRAIKRDEKGNVIVHKIIQDPNNPDTDNDGLFDYEEKKLGTDLNNFDSDDDGLSDWDEVRLGYDPLKKDEFKKE